MILTPQPYIFGKEPGWTICPACKKEWMALTDAGVCIECVELKERIKKESKIKQNEKERKDIYE